MVRCVNFSLCMGLRTGRLRHYHRPARIEVPSATSQKEERGIKIESHFQLRGSARPEGRKLARLFSSSEGRAYGLGVRLWRRGEGFGAASEAGDGITPLAELGQTGGVNLCARIPPRLVKIELWGSARHEDMCLSAARTG